MRFVQILKLLVPLVALGLITIAPAVAGQKEAALLQSFAGDWRGKGKVTGPDPGTVVCRLSFKTAPAGALTYSGRCSFGSGSSTFRGAIIYNDATNRYEAGSTSQGVATTAVGKQSGGGITFSTTGTDTRYGKASSTMTLSGKTIKLSFKLVDKKGQVTASSIAFGKS